jgi:glycosyltransferase involved in cell wall biosynthesis
MGKRVIVCVISDLVTDQRVHKVSLTLRDAGHDVLLIGARRKHSLPLPARGYNAQRIGMLFQRKMLFYTEFNLRLFFRLLLARGDIYLGNDLDVMPAVWLAGRLRGKPVVYDTHEYFLGMPELEGRPVVRKVWGGIEGFIFPRLRYIYTICGSFCDLYRKDYGKELWAVRNVPYRADADLSTPLPAEIERRLPTGKFFLLFQGAGINPERGVEELVMAMTMLDPGRFHLVIIGGGDIFHRIEEIVRVEDLTDRITILPKVPFEILRSVTRRADLGLSLDKPTNINHLYGLPNKIFDYLHSGVPVLVSRLKELEIIVNSYDVGDFIGSHDPADIAEKITDIARDRATLARWRHNTEKVKEECNWEKEGSIILEIFEQVIRENS